MAKIEFVKVELRPEVEGCYFKDKIVISLTPAVVEHIATQYKELALRESDCYLRQGTYREICDGFKVILEKWKSSRAAQQIK